MKNEPEDGGISEGSAAWNSFAPSLPGKAFGMSAYSADMKRSGGKGYVRVLIKNNSYVY